MFSARNTIQSEILKRKPDRLRQRKSAIKEKPQRKPLTPADPARGRVGVTRREQGPEGSGALNAVSGKRGTSQSVTSAAPRRHWKKTSK